MATYFTPKQKDTVEGLDREVIAEARSNIVRGGVEIFCYIGTFAVPAIYTYDETYQIGYCSADLNPDNWIKFN